MGDLAMVRMQKRAIIALPLIAFVGMAVAANSRLTAGEAAGCGRYGTAVQFVDSPAEAARQAKSQEKLVFVLHLSGLFEEPRFT
jgi:hypothetical protein